LLSSKVPEFLHVLFNLVVKHSPDKRANRGEKKTGKNSEFEATLKKINNCVFMLLSLAPHQHVLTKVPKI